MNLGPLNHEFKVGDPVKHRYLMFGSGGLVNDATSRATVIGVTTDLLTVALRNGRNTKMTWKREDVEYLPPPAPPDPPGFTSLYGDPLAHQFKVGDYVRHKRLATDGGLKPFQGILSEIVNDGYFIELADGTHQRFFGTPDHDLEFSHRATLRIRENNDSRKVSADPMPLWLWGVVAGLAVDCLLTVVWIAQHGARPF